MTKYDPEMQLLQSITGEMADDIYVIDKENFNLLYANELKKRDYKEGIPGGEKCYQILYGKNEPCEFCTFNCEECSNAMKETTFENNGRFLQQDSEKPTGMEFRHM